MVSTPQAYGYEQVLQSPLCPLGVSQLDRAMGFAVLERVLGGFPPVLVEEVRGLIRPVVSHLVAADFPPEYFEMARIWVWKEKYGQDLGADVN